MTDNSIPIKQQKRHQMRMAKNIRNLTHKGAQKRQAHLLCQSLIKSIRGAGK